MRKEFDELIALNRKSRLVGTISAILGWDQETYMPPAAVDGRSEQLAYLQGLNHEMSIDPRIDELLKALGSTSANPAGDPALSEAERAFLRITRRGYDQQTKLPADLVMELTKETSLSQAAWAEARGKNDFPSFAPHLEKMIGFQKRVAACLDPGKKPYDVLLDLYEIGATEASIASVFGPLREKLVALLGKIQSRPQVDDSCLRRHVPEAAQDAFGRKIMAELGYDTQAGRLDKTAHPFSTTLGPRDQRITTRYEEDFFPSSLFSVMHESGHAMYEQGLNPGEGFDNTSLADAASTGLHESQSRLWENMVGRSKGFWKRQLPALDAAFGGILKDLSLDAFYKAINKVETSLIRTEADEVTYALHIILRFEIESALMAGSLAVKDVPAAWNEKSKKLLGLVPPSNTKGCLQDIHWSMGYIGYFPGYALGNLYAAQFYDKMSKDLPSLGSDVEKGNYSPILAWLRKNVHARASLYLPNDLVKVVTGKDLDASYFVSYLEKKYAEVYGF